MYAVIDTHTHTYLSGHAYSTIFENVTVAAEKGLVGIVNTDHSPALSDCRWPAAVRFLKNVPREYRGVRIYRGVEADVIDFSGRLSVEEPYLSMVDFLIASMHDVVIKTGTVEENTAALCGALQNPHVDILGHPGNPAFPVDIDTVVQEAARQNKLIEINSHSFEARRGCESNCEVFARACMKYGVRISLASDAHACFHVGEFTNAEALLRKVDFPQELVVTRSMESFEAYLAERRARLTAAQQVQKGRNL